MRIAVCDDIAQEREQVVSIAAAYFGGHGEEPEIRAFSTARRLLDENEHYDIYLLDVLMPGVDGLSAAEAIHRKEPEAVIVFITSSIDSAVDSYRVEAAGFLLKPLKAEDFRETMERLARQGRIGTEAVLKVSRSGMPLEIPFRKIVLMESNLHRVSIVLENEVITVSQKLNDLEETCAGQPGFLRCHQSFLLNLAYACEIGKSSFRLADGLKTAIKEVPISRAYYKNCKKAYYEFRLRTGPYRPR